MVWDVAVPAGTDLIKDGDNAIREFKTDIQAALKANNATLGDEGVFPVSTSSPKYRYRGLKGTTAQRPSFGNYGLYFNETLNTIQRDNGSAWQDVATLIPSGTVMLFYQAAAPVGWTRDVSVNDRFVRIVSAGSPGTTGGSWTAMAGTTGSGGSHSHTVDSHSHSGSTLYAELDMELSTGDMYINRSSDNFTADRRFTSIADSGAAGGAASRTEATEIGGSTGTASPGTDSAGSHTHSFSATHGSAQHQYADFLIATKD